MTRQIFTAAQDGFVGAYYGGPADSRKAVILMLGDSSTDRIWPSAVDAAKSATEGLSVKTSFTSRAGPEIKGTHSKQASSRQIL